PLVKFQIPVADLHTTLGSGGTTAAISPDGGRVVYRAEDKLWIRDMAEYHARELPGSDGGNAPFWSPDGEWIGYGDRGKLYKMRHIGGAPLTVCEVEHSFNPASGGAWGEDGRIVFTDGSGPLWSVSAQGGDPDTLLPCAENDTDFHNVSALPDGKGWIFVVHRKVGENDRIDLFAGGQRRELVFMEGEDISFPVWSPSGHIVFRRSPTNPGIWAVPFSLSSLEVTGEPFLALPNALLPSVSRNGTMLLAPGAVTNGSQLQWVDRNGKPGERIGLAQTQMSYFPLSPQGDRLVIRVDGENADLYVLDVVRQTQTRLTFSDERSERFPRWSPDGKRIYFEDSSEFPGSTMWVTNADGSGEPMEIGPGLAATPSPDGRWLIYTLWTGEGFNWDLAYRRLDANGLPTGDPEVFLATLAIEAAPEISPNGRFVAYHSDETEQVEVYLKPFPSGSGKWQISVDGGHMPHWKADGTELYYVKGNDIWAVSVQTDPVRLGAPELLFTRPNLIGAMPFGWPDGFEVTPDGERFLIAVSPEGQEQEEDPGLVVVQNWYAEIRGQE
ncbi:hypothetical protein K8I85_03555, partial [bacterium]|nr:hypothetical protein [bacterium]